MDNCGIQVPHRTVDVFGFRVFNEDCDAIPIEGKPRVVNTISPNSYGISTRDCVFRESLQKADFLILDGVYFGLAGILLRGKRTRINNGPTTFLRLLKRLNSRRGRVFFLGSKESTLARIVGRLEQEYSELQVSAYSPPFASEFSPEDNRDMVAAINDFAPDVVFVGMTAPKQEKWSYAHRDQLKTGLIVSVGAVFDWYAGNEREIAPIWWKLHMGWLIRTIHRPEILKRYPNVGIFFWHLVLAVLRLKKSDPSLARRAKA